MGLKNNIFYHYFNWGGLSKGSSRNNELRSMRKILSKHAIDLNGPASVTSQNAAGVFDEILLNLRSSNKVFGHGVRYTDPNWVSGVLYAAAGPYSSKTYGNSMLSIQMSPDARVITTFKNYHDQASTEHPSLNWENYEPTINHDLIEKFPGLDQACARTVESKINLRKIMLFVFEDSGVDLIHYWYKTDWFQIVRPHKVQGLQASFMKKKNQSIAIIDQILNDQNKTQEILFKDMELLRLYPYDPAPKNKTDGFEQRWITETEFKYIELQ